MRKAAVEPFRPRRRHFRARPTMSRTWSSSAGQSVPRDGGLESAGRPVRVRRSALRRRLTKGVAPRADRAAVSGGACPDPSSISYLVVRLPVRPHSRAMSDGGSDVPVLRQARRTRSRLSAARFCPSIPAASRERSGSRTRRFGGPQFGLNDMAGSLIALPPT